jgi:hypothetical protein
MFKKPQKKKRAHDNVHNKDYDYLFKIAVVGGCGVGMYLLVFESSKL